METFVTFMHLRHLWIVKIISYDQLWCEAWIKIKLSGLNGTRTHDPFETNAVCIYFSITVQWNPALRSPRYYGHLFFGRLAKRPYIFL